MAQQRTQQAAEHDVNAFQVDEDDYTLPNDTEIEKQVSYKARSRSLSRRRSQP